jgi:hypothetical protein
MALAICKVKKKFSKQSLGAIKLLTKVWGKKEKYLGYRNWRRARLGLVATSFAGR